MTVKKTAILMAAEQGNIADIFFVLVHWKIGSGNNFFILKGQLPAHLLEWILKWWNIVNVKTFVGQRLKDSFKLVSYSNASYLLFKMA